MTTVISLENGGGLTVFERSPFSCAHRQPMQVLVQAPLPDGRVFTLTLTSTETRQLIEALRSV